MRGSYESTGKANPDRQGFNSALAGERSPLNILTGVNISSTDYTPLWDVNVAVWSNPSIKAGQRHVVRDGSLGLLVNCPVIGFLK